jgi:hypothetical protein
LLADLVLQQPEAALAIEPEAVVGSVAEAEIVAGCLAFWREVPQQIRRHFVWLQRVPQLLVWQLLVW